MKRLIKAFLNIFQFKLALILKLACSITILDIFALDFTSVMLKETCDTREAF